MSNADIQAAYGTKPQKREPKPDHKALLVAVIKERSEASESAHIAAFSRLVRMEGYEEYLEGIIERVARMDYPSAKQIAFPPTREQIAARKAERAELREHIQERIVLGMLDFMLPTGKVLGDCTKADLASERGILADIAKKLKRGQKVRDILTNDDIAAIIKARQGK